MKLEKKPEKELTPAHINIFSKKANLKIPDSPPPEPEKEESPKPGEKNSFEKLMQAACSIKQNEMDSRKRKFDLLPAFLKAGVYYSTKLEGVRHPSIPYHQRLFAYELIMKNAKIDYLNRNYESACRKYEEVSTPNLFDNLVGVQYLEILQFYKSQLEYRRYRRHKNRRN